MTEIESSYSVEENSKEKDSKKREKKQKAKNYTVKSKIKFQTKFQKAKIAEEMEKEATKYRSVKYRTK